MGITDYERGLIGELFRKANKLRGKGKLHAPILKAAADRTPMLSQVGRVLEEAGITHVKPAELVKKVLAKATPVTAENVRTTKFSSAPPTSSHHGAPDRRRGRIEIGQDSTNPKLSEDEALWMLKWALSQRRA